MSNHYTLHLKLIKYCMSTVIKVQIKNENRKGIHNILNYLLFFGSGYIIIFFFLLNSLSLEDSPTQSKNKVKVMYFPYSIFRIPFLDFKTVFYTCKLFSKYMLNEWKSKARYFWLIWGSLNNLDLINTWKFLFQISV